MKLFGTDGVRGKAGDFLDAITVLKLAKAAGIYFRKHSTTKKILVGKDTRRSGYMIENALVSGLTAVGYDVIQIGPMPTPAIAYLTESMRCDAGIMISASHNPFEDNGIKFFDNHGDKLSVAAEEEIEKIFSDVELMTNEQVTGKEIGSSNYCIDNNDPCGTKLKADRFSGDYLTYNLNLGWSYNTLNRPIFPTNGMSHRVNAEIALPGIS